jgi:hypothetical protein
MDELFESLTLVQTHVVENFPVILYGKDYWCGLINWMKDVMVPHGTILPADLDLMLITDDPAEVVRWVFERTQQVRHPAPSSPPPGFTQRYAAPSVGGLNGTDNATISKAHHSNKPAKPKTKPAPRTSKSGKS